MGRRGRQARAKTLPKQTWLTTRAFSTQADSGGCSLSRLPETRGKLTGARYTASKTRPRPPPGCVHHGTGKLMQKQLIDGEVERTAGS